MYLRKNHTNAFYAVEKIQSARTAKMDCKFRSQHVLPKHEMYLTFKTK